MLTNAQLQAVETTEGPVRIIAGAGTGKTHTLIHRIKHLIKAKKTDPKKILMLTFTNKAAHEIRSRLECMKLSGVQAMTFHSLATKILRRYWKPDFEILSKVKQEKILIDLLHIDERQDLHAILSDIANFQQAETLKGQPRLISGLTKIRLKEISDAYLTRLLDENALDFGSLLPLLTMLFEERPEVLRVCQEKWDYIMVDEYQDVNAIQIEILKKLSETHRNLCIVGDPDQTIYSWRGSDADNMKNFNTLFPDAQTITLTENFRNPSGILKGAENLISHNSNRLEKALEAKSSVEKSPELWTSEYSWKTYEVLFHILEKKVGSHQHMFVADSLDREADMRPFSDIAILYRTQAEGKRIAAQLAKKGYPYQMSTPEQFWEKPEIRRFLDELKIIAELEKIPQEEKLSDWLRQKINRLNPKKDFESLLSYAVAYDTLEFKDALEAFMAEAETQQEVDNLVGVDKINLLTLHAAKGLEFPIVIIVGLEEDHLPQKKLKDDPYFLAEERRLLYVGMTRAKEELYLFSALRQGETQMQPSRFLNEMGSENLSTGELPKAKIKEIKKKQVKESQLTLF